MPSVYVIIHEQPRSAEVAEKLRAYKASKDWKFVQINELSFAVGSDNDFSGAENITLSGVFADEHYALIPIRDKLLCNNYPALDRLIALTLQK